ncbi:hypothetical protein QUC31_011267 [Theobroma cacao]|uniref:RING-type E3 ubiquitin transferase n=2 Tax=Theobroma cacao TaxID=3641 RepID=A0AB32V374_THECC|nr:PREDICTED: RING-H2 finger protein ATL39 [Theobroma cacao]EOY07552.1 Uncharacterized protein TCM_021959 [Theobroma cacao]WRX25278.1 zinc finger protein [Theobroma cacao]
MDEEGKQGFRLNPILVGLLGVIAGAIMFATFHLVSSVCNCYRRQVVDTANTSQNVERNQQERASDRIRSPSTPRLIPIFRYSKDCNEETCAVCLSDFKEGEQIRVLPDCLHIFHVACIDAWLNLHSNCPLCRADTSPPEQVAVPLPDSDGPQPMELNRLPDFGL